MSNVILFGASGQQGTAIAQQLIQHGHAVIAPVRSAASQRTLAGQGIEARLTDFSVTALTAILREADQVILQVPVVITPAEMIIFAQNALQAIRTAGSPPTVFSISSIVPLAPVGLAGPDARLTLKNMAHQLLPDAVVLSATLYLENFSQAYRQAIEQGGVIPQAIPADVPVAYLSLADLATYILAALRRTDLKGQFIPIGGNESLTGHELARRLGTLLNRPIHYQAITPDKLSGFLTPIIGEPTARQVAEMYQWESTSGQTLLNPDTQQAQRLLGVTLPGFDAWATQAFLPAGG